MRKIKHIGSHFILGKQGREVAKISETQLLECMEILRAEFEVDKYDFTWPDIIEYLQDRRHKYLTPQGKDKKRARPHAG